MSIYYIFTLWVLFLFSLLFVFLVTFVLYWAVVEHKRVVIESTHDEKLVGILHEMGSPELVIICHGFRSSKVRNFDLENYLCNVRDIILNFCVPSASQDRIPMVNLAAAFEKEGISAFRFDFAGNGYVLKLVTHNISSLTTHHICNLSLILVLFLNCLSC